VSDGCLLVGHRGRGEVFEGEGKIMDESVRSDMKLSGLKVRLA